MRSNCRSQHLPSGKSFACVAVESGWLAVNGIMYHCDAALLQGRQELEHALPPKHMLLAF